MAELREEPQRDSVSIAEAREIILGSIRALGSETVGLSDALGRVLAEDVRAEHRVPPHDNSGMDGYAVRSADLRSVPAVLQLVETVPAGKRSSRKLGPGETIRIMTGAPIPEGADAVIMQEYTERESDRVTMLRVAESGANIRRAGSDVDPDTTVAVTGAVLRPAHIGMLAAIGRTQLAVVARPRVAIIATGDELVEPDRLTDDGRIVTSNSYGLQASLREIGAEPVYLGIARDEPDAIAESFRRALRCDAVISTGGVSVGDRDWIKQVLADLGGSLRLWRVRMKPGAPLAFAVLDQRPVFGLPGNPVSTLVTFEQFVRPALLRMMRHRQAFRPVATALLAEDYEKAAGRAHFVRVMLQERNGERYAFVCGDQSSAVLSSMVRADGLAVVPEDATRLPAGTSVRVQLLGGQDLREDPGF